MLRLFSPSVTISTPMVCTHTPGLELPSNCKSNHCFKTGIQGDETSHRFADTWDSVYTAPSLTTIPWLVIAGNHDYKVCEGIRVAYSTFLA
jgi:hypothetical protein